MHQPNRNTIRQQLHSLAVGEDGGAATLSYVMVVPLLMLLVSLVVETSLMMNAKLGTVYAAYAAARTASVVSSQPDWGTAQQTIESAAQQAMIPFASGSRPGQTAVAPGDFNEAYQEWAEQTVSSKYAQQKISDAKQHVQVSIGGKPEEWDSEIRVTVVYDFPFHVPGIGKLIGEPSSDGGYVFPLRTELSWQNDGPQNAPQKLGIGYGQ